MNRRELYRNHQEIKETKGKSDCKNRSFYCPYSFAAKQYAGNYAVSYSYRHIRVPAPLIDGAFIVSYFLKANGSEDHGCISRSNAHRSVYYKIISRLYIKGSHESFNLIRGFYCTIFVQ